MDERIADICSKAVDIYGTEAQIWMAIEEMAELTNAIAKHRRDRVAREDVCEEIADVIIMLIQMSDIFGPNEVNDYLEQKLDRLERKLAKHVANSETDMAGEV